MSRFWLSLLIIIAPSCRVVEAPLGQVDETSDSSRSHATDARVATIDDSPIPDGSPCGLAPPLSFAPPSPLPAAQVGKQYAGRLFAAGGKPPYAFTVSKRSSALAWLSVAMDGALSGVPMTVGPSSLFVVTATDSGERDCRQTAVATVELQTDACATGDQATCFVAGEGGACLEGTSVCQYGALTACAPGGQASADLGHCGPDCGRCEPQAADRCEAGACRCGANAACASGSTCCDGKCVDVQGDAANCGACGKKCEAGSHASGTCVAGSCAETVTCDQGYGRCEASQPLSCPTRVDNDPVNCGSCGVACAVGGPSPKATACAGGRCVCGQSGACGANQSCCGGGGGAACADLRFGTPSGGGVTNCGACGLTCRQAANADVTCAEGVCKSACRPGWTDCGSGGDCSVRLDTDPKNCGACGNKCPGPAAGPGSPLCLEGACNILCAPGFLPCPDGQGGTRCVDQQHDADHCGGCGKACSSNNVAARSCQLGESCQPQCAPGFADCSTAKNDGCEVATTTDVNNCGGCGKACPGGNPGDTPSCFGSKCYLACAPGRLDCDVLVRGCETDPSRDSLNCGACGHKCPKNMACTDGVCESLPKPEPPEGCGDWRFPCPMQP
jgi:hypothetical protein